MNDSGIDTLRVQAVTERTADRARSAADPDVDTNGESDYSPGVGILNALTSAITTVRNAAAISERRLAGGTHQAIVSSLGRRKTATRAR